MKLFLRLYKIHIVMFLLFLSCDMQAAEKNELQKVYHHKTTQKSRNQIELSSLVFYFGKEPVVNTLSTKNTKDGHKEVTFFFPHVTIKNGQCKNMVEQVNGSKSRLYGMCVTQTKKPTHGVTLSVTYDPKKIALVHEVFEAISTKKGVVFRFYNKDLMKKLQKSGNALLQTAANDKKRIVIDCGHGGKDSGTIGVNSIKEKDVNLTIGLQVAQLLKNQGFEVFLTRDKDITLALDERTIRANKTNADLFVSLHSNACCNKNVSGVETFCLKKNLFKKHTCLADNKTANSIKTVHDNLFKQSSVLASSLQKNVLASAKKYHKEVKDRKVKNAVAQVLLGTRMPSALIELGFISNKKEAHLLTDKKYQRFIAQGVCKGIADYLNGTTIS